MAIIRRFIAGARCPQCAADDSIALNIEAGHEWISCVHCDYREDRPQTPAVAPQGEDLAVQIIRLDE